MRRRLILLVVATTSLVLVAFLVPLALLIRNVAVDRAVDAEATDLQSLAAVVASVDTPSLTLAVGGLDHPVTVFLPDGEVVGEPVPRDPAVELAARGQSFTASVPGGREIVVAVSGLPAGTAVIRAFVSDAEMRDGVGTAWLVLGGIGGALLAVSVAVAAVLARSIVRPLTALVRASDALAGGDLAARTPDLGGPPEVRRVAVGLDRLAGRIDGLLQRERETAADLSHRLRTPLTVLRIDGESLRDPEEAARIASALDALERTVSDVIKAAREGDPGRRPWSDAARIVGGRAAFWAALAEDQDRPMHIDVPDHPVAVGVAEDDLAVCVDTLLDNVFAHTPDGVPFTVRLTSMSGGGGCLTVADAGPGFTDLGQAAERGVGSGRVRSTGLGLDIARRTAELSGGTLVLTRSPAGGAAVVVELGPPENGSGPGGRRGSDGGLTAARPGTKDSDVGARTMRRWNGQDFRRPGRE
jgi:signal transduction histidine kinase